MARLFDFDNPVWRFMGRIADMFMLTLLWAVCSIPIVTIGASTTALYYVTLKMAENQESYIIKSFWKSFTENLKTSTGIWGIMLLPGVVLGASAAAVFQAGGQWMPMFSWWLLILLFLYLLMLTLVFPLAARLDTGIKGLLYMAFMVAMKNFSWALLMTVVTFCAAALGIFVFWPLLLLEAGAVAYIHAVILVHVIFPKYNWNNK